MKKRSKLLLALISVFVFGIQSVAVAAQPIENAEQTVQESSIIEESTEETVSSSVESQESSQTEEKQEETTEESSAEKEEAASTEEETTSSSEESKDSREVKICVSAQLDDTESNFTVSLNNYSLSDGEKLTAAVWSDKNGQDDMKWYELSASADGYSVSAPVSAHKTVGTYYAHVYSNKNGFLGSTEFSVSQATAQSVSIENEDTKNGSCDIIIKGITSPSGVKSVSVPIWSAENQSDIKWYSASRQSNGDYKVTLQLSNHKYHTGTYQIHVYVNSKNETSNMAISTTTSFEASEAVISAKKGNTQYSISASNVSIPGGIKKVSFAIWSDDGGQDDLKWFDGSYDADSQSAKVSYNINTFKSFGSYQVHLYGQNMNGDNVFLGSTSYEVERPIASELAVTSDNDSGDFTITLKGAKSGSGIKSVSFAVWSKADQSDLVWYNGEEKNGEYVASSNISKHGYNLGTYYVHAYIKDSNDAMGFVAQKDMQFKAEDAVVAASESGDNYNLKTTNIKVPGKVSKIIYAVWSEADGQDDLKWLTASYNEKTASASYQLNTKSLGDYGTYYVHCYEQNPAGGMEFLGQTTFKVESPTYTDLTIDTNNTDGSFVLTLSGLESSSGIEKVVVPIWSQSDQSDLVWYTAEKDSNGNYVIKSDISKHKYNVGSYQAHVYVTEKNGFNAVLAKKSFEFTISNSGISVSGGSDETYYTARITGLSVPAGFKKVQFAVWSDTNGQDDLKWYDASGSNGNYSASINIKNHKTNGLYYVHVYVQNNAGKSCYAGQTSFTVNSTAKASVSVSNVNNSAGTFKVTVTLSDASSGISAVQVPVWCASDQSDMKWYTATKESSNVYSCTVDVNNHKLNLGQYKIHVYTTFNNGVRICAGTSTYDFNPSNFVGVIKTESGKRTLYLKNASSSASKVKFAVWSDTNGQDDLVWYTGTKGSSNTWTGNFNTNNHSHEGVYYVHCYVNDSFVGSTSFTVDKSEMKKNGWYYENGYKLYYINDVLQTDLHSIIGQQSSYEIKVNRTTNTVTVYANDPDSNLGYIIPVKTFTCSVGLPSTPTTAGVHYTSAKFRWKELMGPSYGQYATRITSDGIYFHSVAGVNMTSYNLNAADYNMLGSAASHGCIRLTVRDAKWIYDYCPLGTKVTVYDSSDPGPYGKPATTIIPAGQTWDPTDPNI